MWLDERKRKLRKIRYTLDKLDKEGITLIEINFGVDIDCETYGNILTTNPGSRKLSFETLSMIRSELMSNIWALAPEGNEDTVMSDGNATFYPGYNRVDISYTEYAPIDHELVLNLEEGNIQESILLLDNAEIKEKDVLASD